VVTRLTLRTRELPPLFGAVGLEIKAKSDAAYRELIGRILAFYAEHLFNPHWGEQIVFRRDNTLTIRMMSQDVTEQQAQALWQPFLASVTSAPDKFAVVGRPFIVALPATKYWDAAFLKQVPGIVVADDRPGAPPGNVVWAGDA